MPWTVLRLLGVLMAASIVWSLFTQYAGVLFLLCAAVAGWRLWLASPGSPRQWPGAGSSPAPPPRQSPGEGVPPPARAPVLRSPRPLDRSLPSWTAWLDCNRSRRKTIQAAMDGVLFIDEAY